MSIKNGQGSFIDNSFIKGSSISLTSKNPSSNFEPVFTVQSDINHVDLAIQAAKKAQKSWSEKGLSYRVNHLLSLKKTFIKNEEKIAFAISTEMGKMYSEALVEAKGLAARIDLMITHGLNKVKTENFFDLRAQTRYQCQGVLAIIGPFNFPAHLVHSHVIPSIIMGNAVVIKPSETCPWVSEIYAECFLEASMPKGVVNVVLGAKEVGEKLCGHKEIDGVVFTGSYKTGRILQEQLLDQPHKILALELGGKNIAVVMDDACIPQTLAGIIDGAFLTTGQRCTATSRVLVHKGVFAKIKDGLLQLSKDLKSSHATDGKGMFGPLANEASVKNFFARLERAKKNNVSVLLESQNLGNGAYVTPSIYEVSPDHPMDDYLDEELFGPNLAIEPFDSLENAIARVNQSSYGLSNAIFTLNKNNFENFYQNTKSGVVNLNRSTNRAFGQLPFGGVNKSGNQRPAGIESVKYATFPVAICEQAFGEKHQDKMIQDKVSALNFEPPCIKSLLNRHRLENLLEIFGIYSEQAYEEKIIFSLKSFSFLSNLNELKELFGDLVIINEQSVIFNFNAKKYPDIDKILDNFAKILEQNTDLLITKIKRPTDINIPPAVYLPRSENMLDRLYLNDFVPKEKKSLVADLQKSSGPFLVSVDENPLIIIDAASQIASVGAGLMAHTFQNAYDKGELDLSLLQNIDLSYEYQSKDDQTTNDAINAKKNFENFLHEQSNNIFKSVSYGSSGAEANEIAFDIARRNGPGGKRIIAFEGAFHGRTIVSLHATYNKEKRGPFVFDGYESAFIPFPTMSNPDCQPEIEQNFLTALYQKQIPANSYSDDLLNLELKSLSLLKDEIEKGDICAVIIEPMQCEGGDKYASNRFFNGLRGLTRAYNVPLIFDEVQTGFHLGSRFFWHQQFDLKNPSGQKEYPDCISLGKKAQLGVCLSVWQNKREYTPHVVQLKRGLLHAKSICNKKSASICEATKKELNNLKEFFPNLVINPRACGFAFAFDMPDKITAMKLIDQRFLRGFMAYIAGENTIRFRFNMTNKEKDIKTLFENIFCALSDIKNKVVITKTSETYGATEKNTPENIEFISLTYENFFEYKDEIERIENESYEPQRRYLISDMHSWLKKEGSIGLLLTLEQDGKKTVGGFAIGECAKNVDVPGPNDDSLREKTFYSSDCVIDAKFKGFGLGKMLKQKQIEMAKNLKDQNGKPRYSFLCGRNRIGFTDEMSGINDSFGVYNVEIFNDQYGIKGAQSRYYRIPLTSAHHQKNLYEFSQNIDCRNSVQKLWQKNAPSMEDSLEKNQFRSIACSKLTLSNWASTNMIRYAELLRDLLPKPLSHAYFTSGRDEVVDKGIRSIKYHKPAGQMVIGFSHQYFGNITGAARSLSHDENQEKPFGFFDWPKVSHPALVGNEQAKKELLSTIKQHGEEKILAIVLELVGEKSGFTFDEEFLNHLNEIRGKTNIPLIFCENTSGFFRNGQELFLTNHLNVKPNMMWWYTGSQLGHVFVDDKCFVEKPLTLISTWDGDDISILRSYNNLKQSLQFYEQKPDNFFEKMQHNFSTLSPSGAGFWTSLLMKNKEHQEAVVQKAQEKKILIAKGFENRILVCPPVDSSSEQQDTIIKTLKEIL